MLIMTKLYRPANDDPILKINDERKPILKHARWENTVSGLQYSSDSTEGPRNGKHHPLVWTERPVLWRARFNLFAPENTGIKSELRS